VICQQLKALMGMPLQQQQQQLQVMALPLPRASAAAVKTATMHQVRPVALWLEGCLMCVVLLLPPAVMYSYSVMGKPGAR
jgi:hypothetical protein